MPDAYRAAGIDPEKAQRMWSKRGVTEALQDRYVKGLTICANRCENTRLVSAAKRLFGDWRSALAAAGVAPERKHRVIEQPE
jgi:hypothetical protein